jgi:hypothetical protein
MRNRSRIRQENFFSPDILIPAIGNYCGEMRGNIGSNHEHATDAMRVRQTLAIHWEPYQSFVLPFRSICL